MSAIINQPVSPPHPRESLEKPTPEKMAQVCQKPSDSPHEPSPLMHEGVNPWAKEGWIRAHQQDLQPVLRSILDQIQFISHDFFLEQLRLSLESAAQWLKDEYSDGKKCVVLVEANKSNLWVAELAIHHFGFKGERYMDLGLNNAESFQGMLENNEENLDVIREKFKKKTIVLFDDASYSGKQMSHHLSETRRLAEKYKLGVKQVIAVVPFMTPFARDLVEEECSKKKSGRPPAFIAPSQRLTMLSDLSPADFQVIVDLWYGGDVATAGRLGLACMAHKVANSESFPKALVSGSVYRRVGGKSASVKSGPHKLIEERTPPYKGVVPDRKYKVPRRLSFSKESANLI